MLHKSQLETDFHVVIGLMKYRGAAISFTVEAIN